MPVDGAVRAVVAVAGRQHAVIDGYTFHSPRRSFEHDRRRDQTLIAAGYRVMRVTWRQRAHEPIAVAVRLATALAA